MSNGFEFAGINPDNTISRKEINLITEKSSYVVAETKGIYQHKKNSNYFHYRYLISVEELDEEKWELELYLSPLPSSLNDPHHHYPVRIAYKFINAPKYSDKKDAFISYIILVASCVQDIDTKIDNYLEAPSETEGESKWQLLKTVLNIKDKQSAK